MSVSALPTATQMRLASLRAYRPGSSASTAAGKLSSNEAPLGPAPGVRQAIARAADQAHRYPSAAELVSVLASRAGLADDQVVVTNGSDELCYLIATLFIDSGSRVVLSDPCYQIDELVTRIHQGDPVFVPLLDGSHDLKAIVSEAANAAVVWLPTPHNPTGVATDPAAFERFLREIPSTCLVVLDEAYGCYVDSGTRPEAIRLIAEYPNLIVQRTFSKAYALAGLRLGYGFGSQAVVAALNRIRPPFNVNIAAIRAAHAALESQAWLDYAVELVRRERTRLQQRLTELGFRFFPSQANFVTFQTPDLPRLHQELLAAGLAARDGADLGFPGWLRVSIGAPPQMATVRAVLGRHKETA